MGFGPADKPALHTRDERLPTIADLVVVGGGVIGLAIAYNLVLRGFGSVVILDKGYLASGASGRNGGGIRQQWSTEINIRLMQESVALCKEFARELGVNVWFRQGGYLFLSRSARETERLEKNVRLQNRCGVPTELLAPAAARDIVPELDVRGFHAACYNPTDGVLFPWPFLWGYAQGAVARGAKLYTFTRVVAIEVQPHGGYLVRTTRGDIRTPRVLNAAGAWSPEIAEMVGVTLPDYPVRHEICSSEPLKPFLGPMVSVLATGLYFSQSMRGEIVGGVTLHGDPPTLAMGSRLRFLATYAKQLCSLMPILGDIKILRQWAGPYDITADGNPILGEPASRPGFYLCCGFMGHGFMMAPVIGKVYAEWLTGGDKHEIFDRCRLDRFDRPGGVETEDFIIG
jgi:heterotetrameric sarcosine oxidase beta subunit